MAGTEVAFEGVGFEFGAGRRIDTVSEESGSEGVLMNGADVGVEMLVVLESVPALATEPVGGDPVFKDMVGPFEFELEFLLAPFTVVEFLKVKVV